jgi:uncharacterized protein with PIN domain
MLAPSPTVTLGVLLEQDKIIRKRIKDREYQRARRAARREYKQCKSCGAPLPDPKFRQFIPGTVAAGKVMSEPCCPYCQNMMWRTQLWWMVRTQRFKLPEATTNA